MPREMNTSWINVIVYSIDDLKNLKTAFCECESKHFQIKSPAEVIRVLCYEGL